MKIKDINQGDILTFKADDKRYKALLCTSTYKEKSPQHFTFAALTIDELEKPSLDKIIESEFFGIGSAKNISPSITVLESIDTPEKAMEFPQSCSPPVAMMTSSTVMDIII